LGRLVVVGIEGPGHYGAGLARHLRAEGIAITEVSRPDRQHRARYGKSDDAEAAGAAAEMVRALRVARTSAVRAYAEAYTALQDLMVSSLERDVRHRSAISTTSVHADGSVHYARAFLLN
jgi:transposase